MTFRDFVEKVRAFLMTQIKGEAAKAWTNWLLDFIGMELPAAWNDRKGDTFSEYVWVLARWRWLRVGIFVFLIDLAFHLGFGTPLVPF